MADFLYYSTFIITVGLVAIAASATRSAINRGGDGKSCVRRFTVYAIAAGLVSGIPIFYGAAWLFDTIGYRVNFGHGEALIAAPIFNFILGIVGAAVGRALLDWRPINW
jgi:hypothetical protein